MVLISIHPFALRKIFLVVAALLCFSAFCFADPVFMAEHYLPPTPETAPSAMPPVERNSPAAVSSGATDRADSIPLRPLDFPTRDHRLLPGFERNDEIFGDDSPVLEQSA